MAFAAVVWWGEGRGGESGGGGVSPFLQLRHLGRLAGFQNPSTTIEPWHFSPGPPILNSPITDGRPSAASPSGPPPWTLGSKFCTSEGPEPSPPSAVRQLGTCMCSHRPTILVSSSSPARSSRARNTARNWSSLLWLWQTRHFPRHTAVATCLSDSIRGPVDPCSPWIRGRLHTTVPRLVPLIPTSRRGRNDRHVYFFYQPHSRCSCRQKYHTRQPLRHKKMPT